jgi:hypothetical protein
MLYFQVGPQVAANVDRLADRLMAAHKDGTRMAGAGEN